ncbi:MAG: sigma-E processing peptidase SpoIIGA [Lachnospiraceae bacterium]
MYCIIYMDVFFFMNFWMDLFLLFLLRYIIRQYRTGWCLLAAFVGAISASGCLLLYLKGAPGVLTGILGALGAVAVNRIAFGKQKIFWHCLLFFLFGSILCAMLLSMVSIFQLSGVSQTTGKDIMAVLVVCVTAAAGCLLLERQSRIQWKEEHMKAKTVLEFGDRKLLATALMDTGNRLYDPFYHRPVILVDESILRDFLVYCKESKPEKLQYIPFHSVGKENGMLEGMMFDRVSIQWQQKTWQFSGVIAASGQEKLYQGKEYQIIFHCGLLEEAAAS